MGPEWKAAVAIRNIGRQLDRLTDLTALVLIDGRPQEDAIRVLARAGLKPSDIARLVGTTPNTVSVTLSRQRKAP